MEQTNFENCSIDELIEYTHILEKKYRLEDENKKKENPQMEYRDIYVDSRDMNELTLYNEIYYKFSVNSDSIDSLNQCFLELDLNNNAKNI